MDKQTRTIDILLCDDQNIIDVTGPVQAFYSANTFCPNAYKTRFVSFNGENVTSSCGLKLCADAAVRTNSPSMDLIIPGGSYTRKALTDERIKTLIQNWLPNRPDGRVISICSGALIVANTGCLDGKTATTHWEDIVNAKNLFPNVDWQMDRIYTIQDPYYTSAGVTSGIDLALEIIRRDCGPQVALSTAREMVVHIQRSGGQTQFSQILAAQFTATGPLAKLVDHLLKAPNHNWTLPEMAGFAGMTPRTLTRHFQNELNTAPMKFLEQVRLKIACDTLSAGMPIHLVISHCGFGDFQRMQRAFKKHLLTTVGEYQKRFTSPSTPSP